MKTRGLSGALVLLTLSACGGRQTPTTTAAVGANGQTVTTAAGTATCVAPRPPNTGAPSSPGGPWASGVWSKPPRFTSRFVRSNTSLQVASGRSRTVFSSACVKAPA